jgi:hypothetical protein
MTNTYCCGIQCWDSWRWTADLPKTCRVLYKKKKKIWEIVQLLGFIIRIYHNAQSSECQTSIQSWLFISVCPDFHIKPRYDGKTPWQDEILLSEVHLKHTALSLRCHTVHAATVRRSSHVRLAELFAFNWWGTQCVSDNVLLFHVHGYISQLHITKQNHWKKTVFYKIQNRVSRATDEHQDPGTVNYNHEFHL